jgi:hypothetical protein
MKLGSSKSRLEKKVRQLVSTASDPYIFPIWKGLFLNPGACFNSFLCNSEENITRCGPPPIMFAELPKKSQE